MLPGPIQPFLIDSFQAFADLHGCLDLLAVTNTYIESHFSEVLDCDEFYALSAEQVRLRNDSSVNFYCTSNFALYLTGILSLHRSVTVLISEKPDTLGNKKKGPTYE